MVVYGMKIVRLLLSFALLAAFPAVAEVSAPSAPAPIIAKAQKVESFRLAPGKRAARLIELGGVDAAAILAVREANSAQFDKRLQIGIGRQVPDQAAARSGALTWERVSGGMAAHWNISSAGARALRVGLDAASLPPSTEFRFAGSGDLATVYGPFTAADIGSMGARYWSPVLEGDRAIVEVFVGDMNSFAEVSLSVSAVSHLFVSPSEPNAEALAKASQACEVDLICLSATSVALANVGRAVARMTFTVDTGGTALCTGTLLNTTAGPGAPYFFSAAHCISTQASASTLTTHWFYDRTGCGIGGTSSSYVQVAGGATLLYANNPTDVLFLRLNQNPPAGARYAGWTASSVVTSTPLVAVHHPAGDLKKVSLGSIGGFSGYGTSGDDHIIALWNGTATGVTEGGSSGSGIFTAVGSPATDYLLRGGLHGGPSSCTATGTALRDYYSRFDRAYPLISQYLNPVTSSTPRLVNIATRGRVQTGANVLIAGFIIGGTTPKKVLITARGPSVAVLPSEVPLLMADPSVVLYSGANPIDSNDDWQTRGNFNEIPTTMRPGSTKDAAILTTLNPGAYTAIVSGVGNTTGLAIVEVFEVENPDTPLVNIATRGRVEPGANVMIAGLIIGGTTNKTVLITARGQSTAVLPSEVPLLMQDPYLKIYSGASVIYENDDWQSRPNWADIPLAQRPGHPKDAAVLVTLPPGAYTAIVSGVGDTSGIAIVEVFAQ